jgi:hypothetical protein
MMKKLIKYTFAVTTLLLISCSGSDNSGNTNTPADQTIPVVGKFTKNVLIEDYTGTWCQFCPRVIYGIQKVEQENLKAFPVAIHRGNPPGTPSGGVDPFNFPASALEASIGLTGYPTAKLNRKITWINETNTTEVKNQVKVNSDLGLALSSTVSGGTINLDVNIKFDANLTGLKLVVYVLEDNLNYNQTNSTSYFGAANPIVNMEHDHVLRACLTDLVNGDPLTGTNDGVVVTKNFSIAIPSNVSNAANINFVAFVLDATGNALNVRGAAANINQAFQENL